jgi:hypothetical protein
MNDDIQIIIRNLRVAEWLREYALPMTGRIIACSIGVGIGLLVAM